MIGNHDLGLLWPVVRKYVRDVIGPEVRVHEAPVYLKGGVWIEHDNQQVAENRGMRRRQFLKIIKEFSIPVKMDLAAKRIFALHPEVKIVVFGHGHKATHLTFAGGYQYFNSGIWNEMISLDLGTIGRSLKLTFIEIERSDDEPPEGRLLEWKGAHREVDEVGPV